ncbi:hypothetical protein PQR52_01560 [Paraburkholderia aspalathi]|uniref:hypothetical protein n=1 Tax=Paraburkholderia aspalathi TaxID=1324617 RepID=UPI0038BCACD1
MKKLLSIVFAFAVSVAQAQTFPVQNLVVNGLSSFAGATSLVGPSTFTLSPAMPTPAAGDNSTKGVNSAFVAGHSPCPSILDNGGDNTGVAPNNSAFATTAAIGPAGSACVYFPPGTYAFSSQATYTLPTNKASITLLGAGQDVTVLTWAAGGGLNLNFSGSSNSAHIRNMSLLTGTTATGSAITFNQQNSVLNPAGSAISDVTNVTIRGSDGYASTDYWSNGITANISSVNFYGVAIFGAGTRTGTGINLGGTATIIPAGFNISGCTFNYVNIGINYGAYVQGVTISQSGFVADNYGVNVPSGLTGLDGLYAWGSTFDTYTSGIVTNSEVPNVLISGDIFIQEVSSQGINLFNSAYFSIVGNSFNPGAAGSNKYGIVVGNSVAPGAIVGNSFFGMNNNAIYLQSTSSGVNVQSNTYSGNATNITNSAGAANTVGGGSQ